MKYLKITFLLALTSCAYSQVDFSAYGRITDTDFQAYVKLFPEQSLPVSFESLLSSGFFEPSLPKISDTFEDAYQKVDGDYIAPKLYTYVEETGDLIDMYESFYPVYKLPTNGDYVLLVIAQWGGISENYYRAMVLTYDLSGNFIKAVGAGYLIDGSAPYVSTSINANLEFSHTHITNASTNSSDFFQCKPCDRTYQTDVYQILNTGQDN
ncbi:MAG: hypothetical protein AAF901_10860, partial [Bacteroidota bacterium]